MCQWGLSASWRSTTSGRPWKSNWGWGGHGLIPDWNCSTSMRILIWTLCGQKIIRDYGIPKLSLTILIQAKTMMKDTLDTLSYGIWTSPQFYEIRVLLMLPMNTKDQNIRLSDINNTHISGGAFSTWNGIHLTANYAPCGWKCQSIIETLWDSIRKRLSTKATRPSWKSILLTRSFSVPQQRGLGWWFWWTWADLCWEASSPSSYQPSCFFSSGLNPVAD